MWHMNQRLKPLYESDGKGSNRKFTFDYVMEALKSIRVQDVEVLGAKSSVVSEPTEEQAKILRLLGITL
jgi:hypothetical protein